MKHKVFNLSTKITIAVCMFIAVITIALGLLLSIQSGNAMKTLIRRHMLSVANTAAAAIDGDVLEKFTEDDVGGEFFNSVSQTLLTVKDAQDDNDIKYIYLAKKADDGGFVFTIDPDPVKPAYYGKSIVYTPSEDVAWSGTPEVDNVAYADEWGCFYTAWSPIRNSDGKVVGIVGVDFAGDWYDLQTSKNRNIIIIIVCLSLVSGGAVAALLTQSLRRRLHMLNSELSVLSDDISVLSEDIKQRHGQDVQEARQDSGGDVIGALSGKVRNMHTDLINYLDYVNDQAYTDPMTGVRNKTAYLEKIKDINRAINSGTANFAVAVFDINALKNTNDNYGHECGDIVITDSVALICRVFERNNVFRIGGDEFIAVMDSATEDDLDKLFEKLDAETEKFNATEKNYAMTISFSHGGAVYIPGTDAAFKEVFKRADQSMYIHKGEFYSRNGVGRPNYKTADNG